MLELWDDVDYMAEEIISSRIYNWETRGDFPAVKWKSGSKVEVIMGPWWDKIGPHPDIRHDDEIEMFSEKEFNELKKKLDI